MGLPHRATSRSRPRSADGGIGPAVVGTIVITAGATLMAVPLGVLGGIYLNEYGGEVEVRAAGALPLRDPHRRAVDRDGPVHLHVLGAAARRTQTGFAGVARAGLPHAAGGDPHVRGDAASSCPHELREGSLALGSRKSRTIRTVVLPHAAPGHRERRAARGGPRPRARRRRCCSCIGAATSRELESASTAPNNALSRPDLRQRQHRRTSRRQERAFGAAFTLILIVFIATAARPHRDRRSTRGARRARHDPGAPHDRHLDRRHYDRSCGRRCRPPHGRRSAGVEPSAEDAAGGARAPARGRLRARRASRCTTAASARSPTSTSTSPRNEITAFIGPSGCGKTTVLRALNRMHDLTPGAEVNGHGHVPRRGPLRTEGRPGRGAPPHRHGVPEAEPVPEVDLRQHRLRPAHQRHAQARRSSTTSSSTRSPAPRCGAR